MGSFPILSRDIKHTFYHPVSQHISALSSSQLKTKQNKTENPPKTIPAVSEISP